MGGLIVLAIVAVLVGVFIVKRKNKPLDTDVTTGAGGGKPFETNHTQEK